MVRGRRRTLASAVFACAALSNCTPAYDPCFPPPSLVTGMRVLAVRADPPEALVDLDAGIVPTVDVRALVAGVADPLAALQLIVQLCVPTADLSCPAGTPLLSGPLSEKAATEATIALNVPAELIESARNADPLHGYGGTRVQLVVEAHSVSPEGAEVASATKTLLFSDAATTPAPNQPIEFEQVDVSLDGGVMASVPPAGQVPFDVGYSYGLRPRLSPLPDGGPAEETYQIVDLSGQLVTLREQVSYDFYAGPDLLYGDLPIDNGTPIGVYVQGASFADEPQPGDPDPADGLVRITPMLSSETRAWVVGRDSRGAVAWEYLDGRISDPRICDAANGDACPMGKECCQDPFVGCK